MILKKSGYNRAQALYSRSGLNGKQLSYVIRSHRRMQDEAAKKDDYDFVQYLSGFIEYLTALQINQN